jgi:tetratricopeptide (TPR) repeat protein
VDAAGASGTPLLLMTVASNWKWRGRSDLPQDWVAELLDDGSASSPDTWPPARAALDERVAGATPAERHEWLFKRAVAAEALGDLPAARDDYRAAMNQDPHLRRALDAMADRVRRVGEERGVPVFDVIRLLEEDSPGAIVGFDHFYDYVHFTPHGALAVGVGLYRAALEAGVLPADPELLPGAYLRERGAALDALDADPLEVGEWMGFGDDTARIRDRDLWKYDQFLTELDQRIERQPDDLRARIQRGNARSFQLGGKQGAEGDYRAALALEPGRREVLANLQRLLAEGS